MGTLWLLDPGASLHFTHNFNDFIEYKTAKLTDRMSVRTASEIIHIEGKGAVLLEHKVNNKLILTCLYPCIISLSVKLLRALRFDLNKFYKCGSF